ncbi:uncharacterized protein LOC144606305 isoform X2 [Rhinoraja longicauda]
MEGVGSVEDQCGSVELRRCGGLNLYQRVYGHTMQHLPVDVHSFCHPVLPPARRQQLLHLLRSIDHLTCQKLQILFSFSVPSAEALTFLADLQRPLISAGATSGPEILEQYPDRILLLAWPDVDESSTFSVDCLRRFQGETLVHVGELLGETQSANPWGQSSSREFQLSLAEDFCCVSRIKLPNWPGHLDSLTLWRRKNVQPVVCDKAHFHYVNTQGRVYL